MVSSGQLIRHIKAFTLIELLVVVAIITLLISILLPTLNSAKEQARTAKCAANLRSLGQAVRNCATEHNGYGPTWDDGGGPPDQHYFMLTWVDLLFDVDALGDFKAGICPNDKRPDELAEAKGWIWRFVFVENMGVGEKAKRGVRTSYAINAQMHWNNPRDKFVDASRQMYAIDAFWSWIGSISAYHVVHYVQKGWIPDWNLPNWQTGVSWRHGHDFGANVLYRDEHVSLLRPNLSADLDIDDPNGLETAVDTVNTFTWLPGERTDRYDSTPYEGLIEEYHGRLPAWQMEGGRQNYEGTEYAAGFPWELDCRERAHRNAWRKLPNDWRNRR